MGYRNGDWYVYCDICGQRTHASRSTKLSTYTGRGGLVVCNHDVDKIDYGLMPFTPRRETNVSFIRPGHTDTSNGSSMVDLESMSYLYYLSSSQDDYILMASQDDAWLQVSEPL